MVVEETLRSVQFVVDHEGRQTAVLLDIQTWETLINWIETVTDTRIARQVLTELKQAGGRPEQAGWLNWNEIDEAWCG